MTSSTSISTSTHPMRAVRLDEAREPLPQRRALPVRWWMAGVAVAGVGLAIVGNERTSAPPQFGQVVAAPGKATASPERFRIATFNIDTGHLRSGGVDLAPMAEALRDVDFVALQEIDGPRPWGTANQAEQLAAILNVEAAFAPTERRWWMDHVGNALLSRLPVTSWQSIPQPGTQRRGHRNAILSRARLAGGAEVNVLATHVDRKHDRELQLDSVCAIFAALAEPKILLGDLNTRRDDPRLAALFDAGVHDALDDAGVDRDPRRIDWILLKGLRGMAGGVSAEGLSDHPCYWADVELTAEAPGDAPSDETR